MTQTRLSISPCSVFKRRRLASCLLAVMQDSLDRATSPLFCTLVALNFASIFHIFFTGSPSSKVRPDFLFYSLFLCFDLLDRMSPTLRYSSVYVFYGFLPLILPTIPTPQDAPALQVIGASPKLPPNRYLCTRRSSDPLHVQAPATPSVNGVAAKLQDAVVQRDRRRVGVRGRAVAPLRHNDAYLGRVRVGQDDCAVDGRWER